MTADRRRRKTRPQSDWLEDGGDAPEERDPEALDREERMGREIESNGAADDEDFEEEDLVEVRIAVGPDGLAEAVTFPEGEDEETPLIERDEKLEQEIEWEAMQPLEKVIDEWDDPAATSDP